MVTSMIAFVQTDNDLFRKLRSKHYSAVKDFPTTPIVYTQSNGSGLSPRLDLTLEGKTTNPITHDGVVAVVWKGKTHRFHLFFRNSLRLPRSTSLRRSVYRNSTFRGDIIVMRKGVKGDEFVNVRSDDKRNINCAVKEFIRQFEKTGGPRCIRNEIVVQRRW